MDSTLGGASLEAMPVDVPAPTLCIEAAEDSSLVRLSPYEAQKRRDWSTFLKYLTNHEPPLVLERCSDTQVIEFLKNLDQFGNTRVHLSSCDFYGNPNPPALCDCPFQQAWGSLDSIIGRLRAAYGENGGSPGTNLFASKYVRMYLRKVKDGQAKARGYEKKKRKRPAKTIKTTLTEVDCSVNGGGGSRGGCHDIGGGGVAASDTGGVVTFDDFSKGQEVEVTSEAEGFKDSWYTAKIMKLPHRKTRRKILIEYDRLMADKEGSKPLQTLVSRSLIRPLPPQESNQSFHKYQDVDAFHNDGWWKGKVILVHENLRYTVYFPVTEELIDFGAEDLRVHHEWFDGGWVMPQFQKTEEPRFITGAKVEVSLPDKHCCGAWFPATVIKRTKNKSFFVQYNSLRLSVAAGLLKDVVHAKHIRPLPSEKFDGIVFRVSDKVDAFFDFGWWSGVVTEVLAGKRYMVHFWCDNNRRAFNQTELRCHMEWINEEWVQQFTDKDLERNKGNVKENDLACNAALSSDIAPGPIENTHTTPTSNSNFSSLCKKINKAEVSVQLMSLVAHPKST